MSTQLMARVRKSKRIVIKSSHQKAFSAFDMNCAKRYCPDGLPRANVFRSSHEIFRLSPDSRSCVLHLSSPLAFSSIRNPSTKSIACRTADDARLKARRIIAVADFNGREQQSRWREIEKLVELKDRQVHIGPCQRKGKRETRRGEKGYSEAR